MHNSYIFRSIVLLALSIFASNVFAEISSSQARKLIARMGGAQLPSSAVKVTNVSTIDANTAEATAEVETAFRLEQDEAGRWNVREVRVAPERWEDVCTISKAAAGTLRAARCDNSDFVRRPSVTEPTVQRARCLIANLLDVSLPSDSVRIKDISPFSVPLSSKPSAVVIAVVRGEVRFKNEGKSGWRVTQVRTGNRDWADIENLLVATDDEKRKEATTELQTLAAALEKYRAERGSYVATDQHRILVDHLSPRYLARIIRVDPWHRPYEYQGERNHFTLRSEGPDGKPNTADDVVLSSH